MQHVKLCFNKGKNSLIDILIAFRQYLKGYKEQQDFYIRGQTGLNFHLVLE